MISYYALLCASGSHRESPHDSNTSQWRNDNCGGSVTQQQLIDTSPPATFARGIHSRE